MTREEMIKRSFKPYMILIHHSHYGDIEMILVSANFDNETFTLRPIDIENFEEEDYIISISKVSFKKKESLKIVK
ncbi:hypothetical protein FHR29_002675 [Sphingobacterium sp. JUb56]|nr:hypothetical protein [Sphingobacterium sp. JUb56]